MALTGVEYEERLKFDVFWKASSGKTKHFLIMSKKLWHPTNGALLAGFLMVTAAHAQEAPISPVVEPSVPLSTAPGAPVPQSVAPPKAAISTPGLDLQFQDIAVKQLLSILANQYNINLAVNADVDGVISSINLVNRTPEEALQDVIAAAGNLTVKRTNSGTYIVNKKQPGAIDQIASNSFNPGGFPQAPIMQGGMGIFIAFGMGNGTGQHRDGGFTSYRPTGDGQSPVQRFAGFEASQWQPR